MKLAVDFRAVRKRRGGHGTQPARAHMGGSRSFLCPQCQGHTQVIDSRPKRGGITRRRACTKCGHRLTTFEGEENLSAIAANQAILAVVKTLRTLATELEQAIADDGEPE